MRLRVKKSNKKSGSYRLYMPKHEGEKYEGEVECLPNALTFTIIKPGATLGQVKRSLEIVLQDVELRLQAQAEGMKDGLGKESDLVAKPTGD